MKKKTTRKRNPQDATLRNVRALKKRVERLEETVKRLCKGTHYVLWDK